MMDKVQKPSNSEFYRPSSESFRFYYYGGKILENNVAFEAFLSLYESGDNRTTDYHTAQNHRLLLR
jgi:hypothetical protein